MVTTANTTLNLCRLERVCLLLLRLTLVLCARFPVCDRPEDDIFCDAGSVCLRACRLALVLTELCPLLALGDAGVYDLLDDGFLDAAGGLDFLAIFADGVGYYRFGSVLILDDLVLRELERVLVFFFGPVGSSAGGISKVSDEVL